MNAIREALRERRAQRMRQGQAVATFVELPSDSEIRFALVPLTDADTENALLVAARVDVPDNVAGLVARDRRQKVELLASSIRDPTDLEERPYENGTALQKELVSSDIDRLYDEYLEMTEVSNPSLENWTEQDIDDLKKALQTIQWNELSGRSWFAAKRFLGRLMQEGHLDSSLGSTSTNSLTTTSE